MSTRSKVASTADEIAAIQELMGDLEKRLHRLGGAAKNDVSDGASEISEFVNETLAGIMDRVRDSAKSVSETVADKAAHVGGDAVKKVLSEVETRPLTMLAIAAGVGFLFGMSKR